MISPLFAAVLAASAASAADYPAEWAGCTVIHIHADGSRTVTPPRTAAHGGAGSASARSDSHGSSSSSVSASASSGGAVSSSASSSANGARRSVTQTRDANGCVVTLDER